MLSEEVTDREKWAKRKVKISLCYYKSTYKSYIPVNKRYFYNLTKAMAMNSQLDPFENEGQIEASIETNTSKTLDNKQVVKKKKKEKANKDKKKKQKKDKKDKKKDKKDKR